jgi:predicted  nucleic acid-binding Zn-ribbon protein
MITTPVSCETDNSEIRVRLAILQSKLADLLLEVAEIEKALSEKESDVTEVRRQIEILTQQIGPSVSTTKKTLGRPNRKEPYSVGGALPEESLPSLIEKLLRENKDGLSLADLIQRLAQTKRTSLSKKPRSMVDQAIFRLKRNGRVVRNPENLKFFLKEGIVNVSN